MNEKKHVLLVHTNQAFSESLTGLLSEMDCIVHSLQPESGTKNIRKWKPLHLCIVDLEIPQGGGILLIRTVLKAHPGIRIIAIANKVTGPLLTRLQLLGVHHILERPLKRASFTQAVYASLSGDIVLPRSDEYPLAATGGIHKLCILIAHNDTELFGLLYDMCVTEGHEIYLAVDTDDFMLKAQMGYYNVIFASEEFIDRLTMKTNLDTFFYDTIKPVLFILGDGNREKLSGTFPQFSFVAFLPLHPAMHTIIAAFKEILPKYEAYAAAANKPAVKEKKKRETGYALERILSTYYLLLRRSRILFYCIIIIIAAVSGFLVSRWVSTKDKAYISEQNKTENIMNAIPPEKREEFKRLYEGSEKK